MTAQRLIVIALALALVGAAVLLRYDVTNERGDGVWLLDRWTGAMWYCEADVCVRPDSMTFREFQRRQAVVSTPS